MKTYSIFHSLLDGEVEAVYCCPAERLETLQDELRRAGATLVGGWAPEDQSKPLTYLGWEDE